MNEKVLNLLALCLKAREVGEFVFFDYSAGANRVAIYSYANYEQIIRLTEGEKCPRKLDYYFYLDGEEEDMLELIAEIETEILKLIDTAKAK